MSPEQQEKYALAGNLMLRFQHCAVNGGEITVTSEELKAMMEVGYQSINDVKTKSLADDDFPESFGTDEETPVKPETYFALPGITPVEYIPLVKQIEYLTDDSLENLQIKVNRMLADPDISANPYWGVSYFSTVGFVQVMETFKPMAKKESEGENQ